MKHHISLNLTLDDKELDILERVIIFNATQKRMERIHKTLGRMLAGEAWQTPKGIYGPIKFVKKVSRE